VPAAVCRMSTELVPAVLRLLRSQGWGAGVSEDGELIEGYFVEVFLDLDDAPSWSATPQGFVLEALNVALALAGLDLNHAQVTQSEARLYAEVFVIDNMFDARAREVIYMALDLRYHFLHLAFIMIRSVLCDLKLPVELAKPLLTSVT